MHYACIHIDYWFKCLRVHLLLLLLLFDQLRATAAFRTIFVLCRLFAFRMHSGRITYGAAFLDKLKWLTFIAVADSECYDFNAPEKDHR